MTLKYIRICSDLHLEGFRGRNLETLALDFVPHDDRDSESILVLAGDISSIPDQLIEFIRVVEPRFDRVLFVAGNHELYHHNYTAWNLEMADRFMKYLPNVIAEPGRVGYHEAADVRFIFGTLWGDGGFTLQDQARVGYGLNDFRIIQDGAGSDLSRFTAQRMMQIHKAEKAQIDSLLKEDVLQVPYKKTVVVTHHLPSRRLVSKRFFATDGSDGINGGFVGDCESILAYDHAPNLWIFGHTHSTNDTHLWKTRCVSNPAGYVTEMKKSVYNTYAPMFIAIGDL